MPDAHVVADAWVPPGVDASIDAAAVAEPDAHVVVGTDAWAPDVFELPDAFVQPDAVVAPICVPETCNGRDDDCDGTVDDGACGVDTTSGSRAICDATTRGARTYLFCRPTASWSLARGLCRAFGGGAYDLVAFTDGVEQDAVRASIDRTVWLGLSDDPGRITDAVDDDYRWVDGSRPSYDSWASEEPSTRLAEGCVRLFMGGTWDAVSCDDAENTNSFVCEAPVP